uniref:FecCD family ABC transporter permease n=1 Tax=Streptococcus pluranimalium TaxID=82348 RepID=UPI003F68CA95
MTHQNRPKCLWLVFFILTILLLLGNYIGLRFGAINFSNSELLTTLRQPLTHSNIQDIVIDIRLPRMLAALFVGAAMSQAGAMMQGITRNVIADPGLLGINAGAGLSLIIAYAFWSNLHYFQILLICLLGSSLAAVMVFILAYQKGKGYNQLRLILAGAMVSTLFSAIGQAITIYFDLETTVIGWQAGGLSQINWSMIALIIPIISIGLILAQLFAHQLTILSLNETVAKALGQETFLTTLLLLVIVLVISSGAVAMVGSIAFVGLIIPHAIKLFVPKDYRLILPLSAYAGAVFLLWVDIISRMINPPRETPISAIIAVVGLPCFLWLIRKGKYL